MKLALSADKRLRSSSIDMPDNLGGHGEESNRMPRRDSAEAVDSLLRVRGAIPRLGFGDCPVAKSKADEYRDKARECEELAQVARDPLVQQQILEIAEKWRTMAAFEEKFER